MTTKNNRKYLTLSQRIIIEKGLNDNESFATIAKKINKDPSTISKEIRRHISYHIKRDMNKNIPCNHLSKCRVRSLCNRSMCNLLCKQCNDIDIVCKSICTQYEEATCSKLSKPPYVCNACRKRSNCLLKKSLYFAQYAEDIYRDVLVSSREGINQSPADIAALDILISPLLKKGQSIAHIYAHHGSEIPCCRKTLYNYIDKSILLARNIDLRRRVRYKVRKTPTRVSIAAREFRVGRTYEDFLQLIKEQPHTNVVEMDTVEGSKLNGNKVLLTMMFRNCSLMLIFLLEEKTQECVIEVFDFLCSNLGTGLFKELFPVILTDNGIEFQHPNKLEQDVAGNIRTKIYYCNPNSSWQKGMIEKNHEYIRLVIPKGRSLDCYTQKDMTLLMNHINSEARDSLNGCNPFKLSQLLLNNKLHKLLHLNEIYHDEVTLRQNLFVK